MIVSGTVLFLAWLNENSIWRFIWFPITIMTAMILDDVIDSIRYQDQRIKELEEEEERIKKRLNEDDTE